MYCEPLLERSVFSESDRFSRRRGYKARRRRGAEETLLLEGYAQVATFSPNTRYMDRFEEAQDEDCEARRGIWSLSEGELCWLRDRGNGIGGGCG